MTMPRRRYTEWQDGEWLTPRRRGFREQCCDCGLVHVIDFKFVDGEVQVRARRDERATAAVRRRFKFKPDRDE